MAIMDSFENGDKNGDKKSKKRKISACAHRARAKGRGNLPTLSLWIWTSVINKST